MRRISLTITFTDDDGETRSEGQSVETSYEGDLAAEHRVAHILASELKVTRAANASESRSFVPSDRCDNKKLHARYRGSQRIRGANPFDRILPCLRLSR